MKEKMLEYLNNYWTSGRDNEIIKDFIIDFFDQYQPERSKREDPVLLMANLAGKAMRTWQDEIIKDMGCGALNSMET